VRDVSMSLNGGSISDSPVNNGSDVGRGASQEKRELKKGQLGATRGRRQEPLMRGLAGAPLSLASTGGIVDWQKISQYIESGDRERSQ